MKTNTKFILRTLAKLFGLQIKYVHYLSDQVQGKLMGREKRILVNPKGPWCEHVFTILHEIAHFTLHVQNNALKARCPWYLKIRWKNERMEYIASFMRRYLRRYFNKPSGREWEADAWAMGTFMLISRFVGRTDLNAFIERHPEKAEIVFYATCGLVWWRITEGVKKVRKIASAPVRLFRMLVAS